MADPLQTYQPPAAVRIGGNDHQKVQIKNVSTGMTRPLYTSCSEHHLAQERIREQNINSKRRDSSSSTRQGRPRFLTLNTLPRMPSTSPAVPRREVMPSPFLKLPTEIRLQIYSLLVLPRRAADLLPSFEKIASSTTDYFDYDKRQTGTERVAATADLSHPFIHIRTIDPNTYKARYSATPGSHYHTRSKYSVRESLQARCMNTTYHCINNPRIEDNLSILRCNKQIHAEAAELLYSSYTFDFDGHIEAVIPFLSDLTPFARSCIKNLRIVKRGLPYCKEFDKCEWSNAMRYLTSTSTNIALRRLELGVVAGRPGENGWDRVARYSAQDFELLQQVDGMEWMQYLLEVQGLQELDVSAVIEHCPQATSSSAMANYVRFSASVDSGFREFLKGKLLVGRAGGMQAARW